MMIDHGSTLTSIEKAGLSTLVAQLRDLYGDNLRHVILFGSKARGDDLQESDVDLLIVLRMTGSDYWNYWNEIVDLTWDIELTYNLVISLILKDESAFMAMRKNSLLLARNIERDGVVLWTIRPREPILKPT